MRISISNLAWDVNEDPDILALLHEYKIDAIDVAPSKYFKSLTTVTTNQLRIVKNWWSSYGVEIVGMQSLLFGTTGLNVFGTPAIQSALLNHLSAVCRIGSELGATRLVFGSPKNRDCSGLSQNETQDISCSFFLKLGDIAADHGVIICLEPNPIMYGANFMTSTFETSEIVKSVNHPAIKMQLDTGAIIINNEDICQILQDTKELVGHVHISEAQLVPPGDSYHHHHKLAHALSTYLPEYIGTIEMLASTSETHVSSVRRALKHVTTLYR
ncbi:TIM barrel protein [Atlantibacter sp.]|uniref:sugar phosphate isomerase/epimerase family protein n=1 Tax=Atlantibacter sp. TaxID=1903473 RepID=UPI0028975177|nr:TIM barrel protein [Atlantibacter sp.]